MSSLGAAPQTSSAPHTSIATGLAQSACTATAGAARRALACCDDDGLAASIAPITSTQTLEQATNSMVRKMDSNFMTRSPIEQKVPVLSMEQSPCQSENLLQAFDLLYVLCRSPLRAAVRGQRRPCGRTTVQPAASARLHTGAPASHTPLTYRLVHYPHVVRHASHRAARLPLLLRTRHRWTPNPQTPLCGFFFRACAATRPVRTFRAAPPAPPGAACAGGSPG